MTPAVRLHYILQKHDKKLLFDYQQSASLTITALLPMKSGSNNMCVFWSVAELSQNKKRKMRPAKTEGKKWYVILKADNLDTGEWLSINALLELITKQTNITQTEYNTLKKSCYLIIISTCFFTFCLSHAIILLICLVECYCHQMSVSLPALRHALLTPSQYPHSGSCLTK